MPPPAWFCRYSTLTSAAKKQKQNCVCVCVPRWRTETPGKGGGIALRCPEMAYAPCMQRPGHIHPALPRPERHALSVHVVKKLVHFGCGSKKRQPKRPQTKAVGLPYGARGCPVHRAYSGMSTHPRTFKARAPRTFAPCWQNQKQKQLCALQLRRVEAPARTAPSKGGGV